MHEKRASPRLNIDHANPAVSVLSQSTILRPRLYKTFPYNFAGTTFSASRLVGNILHVCRNMHHPAHCMNHLRAVNCSSSQSANLV